MTLRHIVRISLIVGLLAAVASCGTGKKVTEADTMNTEEARKARVGKLFGDDALEYGPGAKKKEEPSGGGGIAVNGYLWRASLDTMSFMPLSSADPFGGVIVTDWYVPPESQNERFKVQIYILDRQLRADGLRVSVFRQVRDAYGDWSAAPVKPETAPQLENAILTRARQLRIDAGTSL
ncbi:MAG: DUF3576 domain-containing protein [Alphaproteobacteria bacterium]|nr:DUF3576 domain-containing protein [Alphaproteobacteria bacterium]